MIQPISECLLRAHQAWANCSDHTKIIVKATAAIAAVGALFLAPITLKAKLITAGVAAAASLFWLLFSKSVSSPKALSTPKEHFDAMLALVKQSSLAKEAQNIPEDWESRGSYYVAHEILGDHPIAYSEKKALIFVKANCPGRNWNIIEVISLTKHYCDVRPLSLTNMLLPNNCQRGRESQTIRTNLQLLLQRQKVSGTIEEFSGHIPATFTLCSLVKHP